MFVLPINPDLIKIITSPLLYSLIFFFNDTATTEIYTLSLHDALPIFAQDAEDLARRQTEWTKDEAPRADSSAAARERELAERVDSLAKGLDRAGQETPLDQPQGAARRARAAMQEAADAAQQRDARGARRGGREAADSLGEVPKQLRGKRDSLAAAW